LNVPCYRFFNSFFHMIDSNLYFFRVCACNFLWFDDDCLDCISCSRPWRRPTDSDVLPLDWKWNWLSLTSRDPLSRWLRLLGALDTSREWETPGSARHDPFLSEIECWRTECSRILQVLAFGTLSTELESGLRGASLDAGIDMRHRWVCLTPPWVPVHWEPVDLDILSLLLTL